MVKDSLKMHKGAWTIYNYDPGCQLIPKGSLDNWGCKGDESYTAYTFIADCKKKKVHTYPAQSYEKEEGLILHEDLSMMAGLINSRGEGEEATGGFLRVRIGKAYNVNAKAVDNYSITKDKRSSILKCIRDLGESGLVPQDAVIEEMEAGGVSLPHRVRVKHLKTLLREE